MASICKEARFVLLGYSPSARPDPCHACSGEGYRSCPVEVAKDLSTIGQKAWGSPSRSRSCLKVGQRRHISKRAMRLWHPYPLSTTCLVGSCRCERYLLSPLPRIPNITTEWCPPLGSLAAHSGALCASE